MNWPKQDSQLSLGGLLFVTAGIALCLAVVPRLPRIGSITPSLAPLFVVILMFGWAMIALRHGTRRVWWIGFVLSGIVFLCAACLLGDPVVRGVGEVLWSVSQDPRVKPSLSWNVIETCGVLGLLGLLMASLIGFGVIGGLAASSLFERYWRLPRTTSISRGP